MAADEKRSIWLWQAIISPHMAGLAVALARRGCDVTYVAHKTLSLDRARLGWSEPSLEGVRLQMIESRAAAKEVAMAAPSDSIHLCGGLRANGLIRTAQETVGGRRLRQWVVMETVDDARWPGVLKRLEYTRQFRKWRGRLQGVLAIGHATPAWIAARGMPPQCVYPFAYFLPDAGDLPSSEPEGSGPFRFLFVGQLVDLKRLALLIEALAGLSHDEFRLTVVGSGPLEQSLRTLAARTLPARVDWVGPLPMAAVAGAMARADCLVLPSRHDGWGAVASEALMVGTPVICSDACGAAGVVRASGRGGVFERDDRAGLVQLLEGAITKGRPTSAERASLAAWATCLGADAGAEYLLGILDHVEGRGTRPLPPWEK